MKRARLDGFEALKLAEAFRPEVVLLVDGDRNALAIVEEVVRVHRVVARELVHGAVQVVRSRIVDGIDHTAGGSTILGRLFIGQYTKFLDPIDTQVNAEAAARADEEQRRGFRWYTAEY